VTAPTVWSAVTDVALAARRHLVSCSPIREALGTGNAADPEATWLFTRELGVVVEGSGLAAAELAVAGGWTRPNSHNTAHFPRLIVDIYADSSRDLVSQQVTRPDAVPRAWVVWAAFERELHRPYGFTEVWGAIGTDPGLRVWGSHSLVVPDVFPVQDWAGGVRLRAEYGLNTG